MKISLQLFSSNKLCVAIAQNVQIQARKPAVIPQVISVFCAQSAGQPAGESARNMARLMAINTEKTNVNPKILPLLLFFISSSLRLFSLIQAFPKSPGEYQIPPIA